MKHPDAQLLRIAETVRDACAAAAQRGFDDAAISGLCHEGAAECAIGAIKALDINKLIESVQGEVT